MPKLVAFQIAAVSDRHILAMAREFCRQTNQTFTGSANLDGDMQATLSFDPASDGSLAKLIENSEQRLIQRANFNFQKVDISVVKNTDPKNILEVHVSPRNDVKPKDEEFLRWLMLAKLCFHELVPGVAFQNILGAEANEHYAAREATILKLDEITQELFLKTANVEQEARSRAARDRVQLEKDRDTLTVQFEQKTKELEDNYVAQNQRSVARDLELESREEALAKKASQIERRQTIVDLIKQLDSNNADFRLEVTPGTVWKRRTVLAGSCCLLLLLTAVTFYLYRQEYLLASPSSFSWIRPTGASLSLLLAFVYFLKWLNNWADRHASEEFRLKRVLLDVRRTNLLIEAALEWETETSGPMPDQILNVLSRNLFADSNLIEPVAPVESLVSLLAHHNASLEIKTAAGEVKALGSKAADAK